MAENSEIPDGSFDAGFHALVVGLDAGGCVEHFNDAAEIATGYSRQEAEGKNWADTLMPVEERGDFLAQFEAFRAGQRSDCTMVGNIVTKSGARRLLKWQISPVWREGRFSGSLAIGIDDAILLFGAATNESGHQLHRILSAVEQSPVSVIIADTRGCIEYVNPKISEVTGFSKQELIGQTTKVLESGEMPPEEYRTLWNTIESGRQWEGEIHTRTKSGKLVWQYATISAIKNAQGAITHYVAIMEDIAARKDLEAQLRQAQKMEAVGTLAGGVAHDFNNLLTAINGYSDMLLDKIRPGDPMRRDVEEIKKSGERAANLTRQLLAFGRKQVLRPRVLDLNLVLSEINELITGLIREHIEIVTCLQPNLHRVRADPGQIEQVIINIIINARDAMPNGGKLVILTADVKVEPNDPRKHPDIEPGNYVLLALSDTGVGMDADILMHIFEPFFTTKPAGKGTGLGLSTAYGIVKQSGGYIYASSEPGRGSTFEIYLPQDPPA